MDIIGHWLNVRQGSYQVMGSWRNSHCGAKERRTTKQINDEGNGYKYIEVFREGRLEFWALTEVQKNPLHNLLREIEF